MEIEFLVVGAGPAGAALACFLTSYGTPDILQNHQKLIRRGLKGLMISNAPGTANTPRAHITNMAALECLRDIGLDKEIESLASQGHCMTHTRWCHSMASEEYARIHSWGNAPDRKGDYELASPCAPVDLPQTLLEPMSVKYASLHGFKTRFDTTLLHFYEDVRSGLNIATLRDKISGLEFQIRSRYLFGADGARSVVMQQLDLPLSIKPGQGMAINVLVKADLSHLMQHRQGNLHWLMQPDCEHPEFGWIGIVRMVKPWHEWMFILFPHRDCDPQIQPSTEEYLKRVKEFIGDNTPAEILDVSKWFINETVAEKYSEGNVFCLGDAVHRHPPFNGLGSNTCIQDAFNLAWKVAYVHRGVAPASLLSTYNVERQPVGRSIVARANDGFREHFHVWESLGILHEDVEARKEAFAELTAATIEGHKRRRVFQEAIKRTCHEFHGLGTEMGQMYSGSCVYAADEPHPYQRPSRAAQDEVLYYEPSTYPGCRLPHAWLNKTVPAEPQSTIDITGHGAFTLLTGIGGERWRVAVEHVSAELGVPIKVHSIGFRQNWEDVYFEWERLRGVEDSGAILVRPDRFVAWRAPAVLESEEACQAKISQVLRAVLGYKHS